MSKIPVALQLYTVRDQLLNDFPGVVRKVAAMGYAGVEFAGTGNLSAAEMSDILQETGLKAAGSHIGLDMFQNQLDEIIAYNKAIGNIYLGIPALPREYRSIEALHKAASLMNEIGATLKEEGLILYYHNHNFEFMPVDGVMGMDILLGETDPELVKFEVDVYWVTHAGADPTAFITANAGRLPMIHLKDMIGEGDERTFAEVGEGYIDFEPIFQASEAQDAVWYIVEQDRGNRPSLESAQISINNLKKWGKA